MALPLRLFGIVPGAFDDAFDSGFDIASAGFFRLTQLGPHSIPIFPYATFAGKGVVPQAFRAGFARTNILIGGGTA